MEPISISQPSSLQELTVAAICGNLAQTICEEMGSQLKLRRDITMPLNIATRILNFLIKSLNLDPMQEQDKSDTLLKFFKLFTDASRCTLNKIVLNKAPISDDIVEVMIDLAKSHSLTEIDLSSSSDTKADYRANSAPYNHSLFLMRFLIDVCGKTLKSLILTNTSFINSIQQINSLSGKKAKVLGQDQYLASDATIEDMPFVFSVSNSPKLENLDVSSPFTGWFIGIDPDAPPPLRSLCAGGYSEKRLNSFIKEILRNIAFGEPDYPVPDKMPATIAYPKGERKMYKYRFFSRFGSNRDCFEKFVKYCKVREYIEEDDILEKKKDQSVPGNFILRHLNILSMKETLLRLSLFGTYLSLQDLEGTVFQLKNLIHLDLAWPKNQSREMSTRNRPAGITVWRILDTFPCLRSLDVSGTPWAQVLYEESEIGDGGRYLKMDRERTPLQFLGLWGTKTSKLKNIHLLAERISGEGSLEQLVLCLELYMHSSKIISSVVSNISEFLEENVSYEKPNYLLDMIVRIINRNRYNSTMLFECVGCVYYLLQMSAKSLDRFRKRSVIEALVLIIENNISSEYVPRQLLRNSMILFSAFQLPQDVMFDFDHIISLGLRVFQEVKNTSEIGMIAGSLCNALVCTVEMDVKSIVRKHGFLEIMIGTIEQRLQDKLADEVLDTAWSALWNLTDETPKNSEDVISSGGLELFIQCYQTFPQSNELHRNMTGMIGNISEVGYLRPHLAKKEYVDIYCALALVPGSGIEVGYNASSILSNLLIDESDILKDFDRGVLRGKIRESVLSWDVDVARNINYRTFAPLLAVLECRGEPEAHLWVMWALQNLCDRDGKYVDMIIKEGGVERVREIRDTAKDEKLEMLASKILVKCHAKLVSSA